MITYTQNNILEQTDSLRQSTDSIVIKRRSAIERIC